MPNAERLLPEHGFGFTEREQLFDVVSDQRLYAFIADEATAIHSVQLSTNAYGEFLFVTLSRPGAEEREVTTFFGLGFHEYRERWFTNEWHWYESSPYAHTLEQTITKEETEAILRKRQEEISPSITSNTQSERGRLFEMLADLTDEDGALTELDDLGDWFEGLE